MTSLGCGQRNSPNSYVGDITGGDEHAPDIAPSPTVVENQLGVGNETARSGLS
jgi:hypothetical protein